MNRLLCIALACLLALPVVSQDQTILSIGDKQFSLEEFNYIYNKNNSLTQEPISKKEYVDLFVNYKLKVEEAIAQGYDTMPSFRKELSYYRNELAKPYLTDKKATDEVIKEAYEHMCYEVDASHILIKLPQSPTPEDTLKAYKKIADIKKQIDNGAVFEELAVKLSEGPSAPNKGRLGYFGAFMMVYPFEKAAYNTPVGEVSEIARTNFGYHLIKVHDKRKNRGEILVAHIMKAFPYGANKSIQYQVKEGIDSVYQKLQNGESFSEMVSQFSDDKQTIANNGKLPWFGTGRMVPEFSDAAFALTEDGQYSEPVKTQFGWHIIKRIDVRGIKSLEDSREEILQKIKRDERAFAGKKATILRLKNEYNYQENTSVINKTMALAVKSSKEGKEQFVRSLSSSDIVLATYGTERVLSADFVSSAFPYDLPSTGLTEENFEHALNRYIEQRMLDHEKSQLEIKYPEFKFLMNEYHDGLLIFEISQNEIWNKASNDSTGLEAFYQENKEAYRLGERFEGRLIYCKTKAAYKEVKKQLKKDPESDLSQLSEELSSNVKVENGRFFKGDDVLLDKQLWKEKKLTLISEYPYLVTDGERKLTSIQPLDEIRGQVISDYQAELEERWLQSLKEKYQPKVSDVVL